MCPKSKILLHRSSRSKSFDILQKMGAFGTVIELVGEHFCANQLRHFDRHAADKMRFHFLPSRPGPGCTIYCPGPPSMQHLVWVVLRGLVQVALRGFLVLVGSEGLRPVLEGLLVPVV
jgi:hypothetical protein